GMAGLSRYLREHSARDEIGRAPRRVGHDDAHRFRWPLRRAGGSACCHRGYDGCQHDKPCERIPIHAPAPPAKADGQTEWRIANGKRLRNGSGPLGTAGYGWPSFFRGTRGMTPAGLVVDEVQPTIEENGFLIA